MRDTSDRQLGNKDDKTGKADPQINRAIKQQGETIKTLEKMVEALEEDRKAEVERLVRKQKDAERGPPMYRPTSGIAWIRVKKS